jgi:hypothetical protein
VSLKPSFDGSKLEGERKLVGNMCGTNWTAAPDVKARQFGEKGNGSGMQQSTLELDAGVAESLTGGTLQ